MIQISPPSPSQLLCHNVSRDRDDSGCPISPLSLFQCHHLRLPFHILIWRKAVVMLSHLFLLMRHSQVAPDFPQDLFLRDLFATPFSLVSPNAVPYGAFKCCRGTRWLARAPRVKGHGSGPAQANQVFDSSKVDELVPDLSEQYKALIFRLARHRRSLHRPNTHSHNLRHALWR